MLLVGVFLVVPVWSTVAGALTVTGGAAGAGRVVNPSRVRGDFPGVPVLRTSHSAKLAFASTVRHTNDVKADAGEAKGLWNPGWSHKPSCHSCRPLQSGRSRG